MSATVKTWAVDLADVGAVYPMVGTEGILVAALVVFWLGWHVLQSRAETKDYEEEKERLSDPAEYAKAMHDSK